MWHAFDHAELVVGVVNPGVMFSAQQHPVANIGFAVVGGDFEYMVGVTPGWWGCALVDDTTAVSTCEGLLLSGSEEPFVVSEMQDLPLRA